MTSQVMPMRGTRASEAEKFWRGVWRIADPKITLASVASLMVGAAAAYRDGPMSWGWLLMTVLGIFCVEAAKNASGEIFDFDSGADLGLSESERTPFSGGKRVLVDRLMTRKQTIWVAFTFYVLGAVLGGAIVFWREPRVLWLGLVGFTLAFFYHAPPLRLSYRGLGELAVGVAYGPLISMGTYLVLRGHFSSEVLLLSLPLAILISAFLWINEFPDSRADELAGKRTLVVRLGRAKASVLFAWMVGLAFSLLGVLGFWVVPYGTLLGWLGAPFAIRAARRVCVARDTPAELIPAQGWTLLAFVLYAIGASAGLVISA